MKIGLYGGTFDPVHHGHLILARTALEELELDSIIFIPAGISPHKLASSPTPSVIRWEMILASIDGQAGILADPYELDLAGPSYTFDTVQHYRRKFPDAELFYFIGYDNLEKLDTWHRIEELKSLVTLVVLDRGAASGTIPFPQIFRRYDISASDIRNRVAKGLSIRYLVTPPVDDIIRQHHLYQTHSH